MPPTSLRRHLRRPSSAFAPSSPFSPSSSCNRSPSAVVDLLILVLVLFSSAFLVISFSSHVIRCISHVLPPLPLLLDFLDSSVFYSVGIILVFLASAAAVSLEISSGDEHRRRNSWFWWTRRCRNPRCKGLKKAMEFDVRIQTDDCLKAVATAAAAATGDDGAAATAWMEIDDLPWKGGENGRNPLYECLRNELRRIAPPNGRAVLLFRARCGCPVAKLEAWGSKRNRKHKKFTSTLALRKAK